MAIIWIKGGGSFSSHIFSFVLSEREIKNFREKPRRPGHNRNSKVLKYQV